MTHSSNSSSNITSRTPRAARRNVHISCLSPHRNILESHSNFPEDSFDCLLAGMRLRSRAASAQRRLLFFKLSYGTRTWPCRWRANGGNAGAGTSHGCRDETHTAIFDSSLFPICPFRHRFFPSVASSRDHLHSASRAVEDKFRNSQNNTERYVLPFILIFS